MMSDPSKLEKLKLKIKALLEKNVSRGATEEEAASAMRAASRLMDEYDLTEAEILGAKRVDRKLCVTKKINLATQHFPFSTQVCWGISEFLDIKWWETSWANQEKRAHYAAVAFFGPETDVELAEYLFWVCHNGIEMSWKQFTPMYGQKSTKAVRQTFYLSAAQRLNVRIKIMKSELRQPGTSLVVLKNQLVQQEYDDGPGSTMRTKKARHIQGDVSREAATAGYNAANKINLTSGLPGGASGAKQVGKES